MSQAGAGRAWRWRVRSWRSRVLRHAPLGKGGAEDPERRRRVAMADEITEPENSTVDD